MKRNLEAPLNTEIEECSNWEQSSANSLQMSIQDCEALYNSSKRRKRENRWRSSQTYIGNNTDKVGSSLHTCHRRSTKRKRFFEGTSITKLPRVNRGCRKKPREEDIPPATIGQSLPKGPLMLTNVHYCLHCNTKKFMYETLHFCYCNGEVVIAANEFPDELCRLFISQEEDAKHFQQYSRISLKEIEIDENTQIVLNQMTVLDQRVYNAPFSTSHILVTKSALRIFLCMERLQYPFYYYGCYDPLQYPLLFYHGECGWTQNLRKQIAVGNRQTHQVPDPINSCAVHTVQDFLDEEALRVGQHRTRADKYVSPREYYAYKLQIRPHNMLLRAGRCFQQFVVDMYVKIENTRLDYSRNNQNTIRADLYQGILDSVTNGETDASKIGHVILPPSFIGCPRDHRRRYLNAMALVQRYGKPDLFITMTCNANWPEIKAELLLGEKEQDRPDIVARIFR